MKVGIVIVHYGQQELLDNCLKSFFGLDWKHADPRVFDCNKNNIGFSRGNNVLIKEMLSEYEPSDWIWLLNNDTTVPKETLDNLEKVLSEVPDDVGILGFQIRSMDDPDLIHHAGTHQSYPGGVHKSGSVKLGQFNEKTFEKWVTFASVLIRREVFETIGLLDERMFNYYSDSDFCFRSRYCGWKVQYIPELVIYHKIGSSQNPNEKQVQMIKMDQLMFENKWMNGKLFFDLENEVC